jgi:hypothetical protein
MSEYHLHPLQTLPRVATVQGPDQNQWITGKIDPSSGYRPILHGRCIVFISHLKEFVMTERNVDVMDRTGKVLHTYPITIGASNPSPKDADYQKAALSAARVAKLVSEPDFASLTTHVHTPTQSAA